MTPAPAAESNSPRIAPENDFEARRLIVLSKDCRRIAILPEPRTISLPVVHLRRRQRRAIQLNEAVLLRWRLETYCLFSMEAVNPVLPGYDVLHCSLTRSCFESPLRWLELEALGSSTFSEPRDLRAVLESLLKIGDHRHEPRVGPFAVPGWPERVLDWIRGELSPQGWLPTGRYRQLHASPKFALLRIETTDRAVWFKAVDRSKSYEMTVHGELARTLPEFVSPVLADHPEWNGWIMPDVEGTELEDAGDGAAWVRVAASLADFQIASIAHMRSLLFAGCRDFRGESLATLIDEFLATVEGVMASQSCRAPEPLGAREIAYLGSRLREACAATTGLPEVIGTFDGNPGNVILTAGGCTFLDWGEACIGSPFHTLHYLIEQHRRLFPEDPEQRSRMLESFATKWKGHLDTQLMAKGLRFAPLLAAFAFAVAVIERSPAEKIATTSTEPYFRSVVRRAYREAMLLRPGDTDVSARESYQSA